MKVSFFPEPGINTGTVTPPAELNVYESTAADAITVSLTHRGAVQGGMRLSKSQARLLARTLEHMAHEEDA